LPGPPIHRTGRRTGRRARRRTGRRARRRAHVDFPYSARTLVVGAAAAVPPSVSEVRRDRDILVDLASEN